jgi:hypothetical protein
MGQNLDNSEKDNPIPQIGNFSQGDIPMSGSNIHQQAINSIIEGAREGRRLAENTIHEIIALLTDLAFKLDGRRMQAMRREEADAPRGWHANEWRLFFKPIYNYHFGWPGPELDLPTEEEEKMKVEIEEIRAKISRLKVQLGKPDVGNFTGTPSGNNRGLIIPHLSVYPKPVVPRVYEDIIEPLSHMKLPRKPPRFQAALGESESLYRRQLMLLYLLATKGVNVRIELDLVMAGVEGISPRASVVRKIVEKLVKGGLLESEILSIERPLHTSINLVRMTEDAKDFCRVLSWEVCESESERLKRLQGEEGMQEKNLAITILALHARLRGYRVKVLPETKGKISSDVLLTDAEQNAFQTFVLLEDSIPEITIERMKAVRGRVGICALDPKTRDKLVQECRQKGVEHGAAADFLSLIVGNKEDQKPMPISEITRKNVMWAEEW